MFEAQALRLHHDQVVQPDGQPGTYTFVDLPASVVAIVPLTADDRVFLVRQWRYPWNRNSWEIPAGHCEPDEPPLAAARRELAEEVGVEATDWQPLGSLHASAIIRATFHLYLARDLRPITSKRDATEDDLLARDIPLSAAIEAAMDGTIVHAVTIAALLRTARLLGR